MHLAPFVFNAMIFFHRPYKLLVLGNKHTVLQLLTNYKASLLTIEPMAEFILESINQDSGFDYLTSHSKVQPILNLTSYAKNLKSTSKTSSIIWDC